MTATAIVDPMGVTGTPTEEAAPVAALIVGGRRKRAPRKPDPEAPARLKLVQSFYAEARKAFPADAAAASKAAITQLLALQDKRDEKLRFKVADFRDKDIGIKEFYNFRIAWHQAKIVELEKARDTGRIRQVNPAKAQEKIAKIGNELRALAASLKAQGIDISKLGGADMDLGALLGVKLG